jgi:hypothetical protein
MAQRFQNARLEKRKKRKKVKDDRQTRVPNGTCTHLIQRG